MDKNQGLQEQILEIQVNSGEEIDPEFLEDFIVEVKEHIENIEASVLALETEPENSEIIHSMFRSFHTIKGLAGFVNQIMVREIAHRTETLMDECRKGNRRVTRAVVDSILKSADCIKKVCDDAAMGVNADYIAFVEEHLNTLGVEEKAAEALTDGPSEEPVQQEMEIEAQIDQDSKPQEQEDEHESHTRDELGESLKDDIMEKPAELLEEQNESSLAKTAKKLSDRPAPQNSELMRIPVQKVDNLVDMMGELIIMQSLIEQEAEKRFGRNDSFINTLHRMARITKDIQNLSMSLRMISLKSTFQKINRIARDTIQELEKDIIFDMQGEETEIDRGVAEKLLDPLVHLVKNAISHGIEDPDERRSRAKPAHGKVQISAYSKRGSVYIEIFDDGKGICPETIHKKALEKKLIDPDRKYSEKEIIDFIFLPGFSTVEAKNINNVSGRGVGMDVVKTEVSKIGGKVEIDSRLGQGTSFTLKIPINLAVMNGTIVDLQGNSYIIPTHNVKQILQPKEEQWVSVKGQRQMIRIRDDIIAIIPIDRIFGWSKSDASRLIIVLELEQKLLALPVSNVVGRREIVVKPLDEEFADLNFVSGASILGNGNVSLILDIENLFKLGGVI